MLALALYNHGNNGDVFISRELVRYVMKHIPAERYIYYHRHSPRLLADVLGIEQRSLSEVPDLKQNEMSCALSDGTLCLNTWYAVSPVWNGGRGFGCTLNTLHELLRAQMRRHFNHVVTEPVEAFLPVIDFEPFTRSAKSTLISAWYAEGPKRVVMLCNGEPMSGQTRMPSGIFEKVLNEVIDQHPEVLFLLTNSDGDFAPRKNLDYTARILGTPPGQNDLCEIAWLSRFCDVVVGRASGPYSFSAYLRDNFFDAKKTMVCFTDDERTARWVYPLSGERARVLWSRDYRAESMRALIEEALA